MAIIEVGGPQPARSFALVDLPVGRSARVVAVDGRDPRLAVHGMRVGILLHVEQDAPFRGPRIVRLGSARIAIARETARAVRVVMLPPAPGR
jgi:Fe2+ transport system protein FeoA